MGSRGPTIQAVIFDLDGVLVDTESIFLHVDADAVARYGGLLTDDLRQRSMGLTHEAKDELLVRELGLPVAPEQLSQERAEALETHFSATQLMPGAAELVARLSRAGVSLGMATSSTLAAVKAKLQGHGALLSTFGVIATADHPGVRHSKPAPDVYLAAADELGVQPANCLAFEDSPTGIESALAAGVNVIAIPDARLPAHPILDRVDAVLASLLDFDPAEWGISA